MEEELLPAGIHERLRAVQGLGKGQTAARETEKVAPVPVEHVQAVHPHLPPPVAAMVRLQLLTGARPQEVIGIQSIRVAVLPHEGPPGVRGEDDDGEVPRGRVEQDVAPVPAALEEAVASTETVTNG